MTLPDRLAAIIAHTMREHDAYEQLQAAAALGVLHKLPDAQELPLSARSRTNP